MHRTTCCFLMPLAPLAQVGQCCLGSDGAATVTRLVPARTTLIQLSAQYTRTSARTLLDTPARLLTGRKEPWGHQQLNLEMEAGADHPAPSPGQPAPWASAAALRSQARGFTVRTMASTLSRLTCRGLPAPPGI